MSKTKTHKPVQAPAPEQAAAPAAPTAPTEQAAAPPAAPAIPKGYWEAADGSLVPESKVSDLDKARDALVREMIAQARKTSADLAAFKGLALKAVEAFVQRSAAQYGVVVRGAAGKGNVTLSSFDGRFKVERQIAERVAFDERMQVARQAIDECVHRWGKGSNDNIKALVNHAFKVDKAGRISVSGVLSLRRIKISDAQWLQAMEALADSVHAVASVSYVRFYVRDDASGEYQPISLNAAAV